MLNRARDKIGRIDRLDVCFVEKRIMRDAA